MPLTAGIATPKAPNAAEERCNPFKVEMVVRGNLTWPCMSEYCQRKKRWRGVSGMREK